MFETIISLLLLSLIIIFLIMFKKIYNKIEKIKNESIDWKNHLSFRIEKINMYNLEKDFNTIKILYDMYKADIYDILLYKYNIEKHIEDILEFVLNNKDYELNEIIIRAMYNKLNRPYYDVTNKKLLNSFHEYGVMLSSVDNKFYEMCRKIEDILRQFHFKKEKV